jgi:perosamine synthetase
MCAHREPAYQVEAWSCGVDSSACNCQPGKCQRLVESEQAQDHAILLPLFHQMTKEEQDRAIGILKTFCFLEPVEVSQRIL